MAEDSNVGMEDVGIRFGFEVDQKSEKKAKKSFTEMTSLVADLSIIGKVAGDALGKMWDGIQKSIEIGVKGFQQNVMGQAMGFDNTETNRLRASMDSIGMAGQTDSVMAGINALQASITDPQLGEKGIKTFYETMGRAGNLISEDMKLAILDALKGGNNLEATQLLGQAIHGAGDRGSEIASLLGLDALAALEGDKAFENFFKTMNDFQRIYQSDVDAMGDLALAKTELSQSLRSIGEDLSTLFVGPMGNVSRSIRIFAEGLDVNLPRIQSMFDDMGASIAGFLDKTFGVGEGNGLEGTDTTFFDGLRPVFGVLADWAGSLDSETNAAKNVAPYIASILGDEVASIPWEELMGMDKSRLRSELYKEGQFDMENLELLINELRATKGQPTINLQVDVDGHALVREIVDTAEQENAQSWGYSRGPAQ